MKKILLVALTLCLGIGVSSSVEAQQDARYTQYMFNKLVLNPGYTGSTEALSLTALYRTQWVNIEGGPTSVSLSAHSPLGTDKKIGLGGHLQLDQIGVHRKVDLFLSYAYKFILGESRLAIGVQGGVGYLTSDYTSVTGNNLVNTAIDPVFQENESILLPNFGVGLYYYRPNKFYLGASAPHLLKSEIRTFDVPDNTGTIIKVPHQERHYNIMGGLVFGKALKIKPSVLLKWVPNQAPIQLDANLMFLLRDALWFGLSYRNAIGNTDNTLQAESLDFIVAFQLKQGLKIGYAYDYTLSDLQQFAMPLGSHEIMLGFDMKGKGVRYHTPRYF